MNRLTLALLLLVTTPVLAYTKLFGGSSNGRTIEWSYDHSCAVSILPGMHRAADILDRLLDNVTITYLGADGTGYDPDDAKSGASCHDFNWFLAQGMGQYGAFVDHGIDTSGTRLFDMVFRDDIVVTDGGAGAALHEWTHVLGLNHSTTDHWSAVYASPFGFPGAANPHHMGWSEYLSNDDLVGLSDYYNQAADCTPYLSVTGKLYLPFIPANGSPGALYTAGHWAVLQHEGGGEMTLLEKGTALTAIYDCDIHFTPATVITATGFSEATGEMVEFVLTNVDTTSATITNWTIVPY